jgi:serine/threonine-protein kinase RsbW
VSDDGWRIRLELPAETRHLHVIRLTVAGAAAEAGLDIAEIDDVKIAVDELCSILIEAADGAEPLALDLNGAEGSLTVEMVTSTGAEAVLDELAAAILGATVDDLDTDVEGGRARWRLTKTRVSA